MKTAEMYIGKSEGVERERGSRKGEKEYREGSEEGEWEGSEG